MNTLAMSFLRSSRRATIKRYFADSCHFKLSKLKLGSFLGLDFLQLNDCQITVCSDEHYGLNFDDSLLDVEVHELDSKNRGISGYEIKAKLREDSKASSQRKPFLEFRIPEVTNLSIRGNCVALSVQKKFMGNLDVASKSGFINFDSIKGEQVVITSGESDINIRNVLEGNSHIVCRSLAGKLLLGDKLSIICNERIDVESLHAADTTLHCRGSVHVGSCKGTATICSGSGDVHIRGVDGCIDVVSAGPTSIQVNKLRPNSLSRIENQAGIVAVDMDPKVHCAVFCTSKRAKAVTINTSTFLEAHGFSSPHHSGMVAGEMLGDTARMASLAKRDKMRTGVIKSNEDVKKPSSSVKSFRFNSFSPSTSFFANYDGLAKLSISAEASIHISTTNWVDLIARKYGLVNMSATMEDESKAVISNDSSSTQSSSSLAAPTSSKSPSPSPSTLVGPRRRFH